MASLDFNMNAAIHNDEVRRQRLEGKYLYRRLAKMTGRTDGREIVAQIELWKRMGDAAAELGGLFKHLDKEYSAAINRNTKAIKMRQCPVCGRLYRGSGIKKAFGGRKVCEACREGWDAQQYKGKKREPKPPVT